MALLGVGVAVAVLAAVGARNAATNPVNPYTPTPGWTYALEAAGRQPYPSCPDRFLTYKDDDDDEDDDCSTSVTLGASADRRTAGLELLTASQFGPPNSTFFIKLGCGQYLSYASACGVTQVNDSSSAGIKQAFKFGAMGVGADGSAFGWRLEAIGRLKCTSRFLSFPAHCSGTVPLFQPLQRYGACPCFNHCSSTAHR